MNELINYVMMHTQRGECQCGQCSDKGDKPDPTGHTVDMVFFKVAPANGPTLEEFTAHTKAAKQGYWCEVDPFDGKEHSYLELGAWIGDQGIAMLYMALGTSLGAFSLLSPALLGIGGTQALQMAGMGLLSIQAKP